MITAVLFWGWVVAVFVACAWVILKPKAPTRDVKSPFQW